tara:strand:- start:3082 stop:3573 length:492 start_codon:yes stop_codon:yes gene_type:complete
MAEAITYPNLELEMSDIGTLVVEEMVERLFDNNSVVTGNLARSIIPGPTTVTDGIINQPITLPLYGIYVDEGSERKKGGQPPIRAIIDWIKQKRISVPAALTPIQFAWAVAKSIEKKGQRFKKPKPFIEVSLNAVVENNLANIGTATALDIDEYIEDNYEELG